MAGTFRPSRGGPGWSLDWEGKLVLATLVEASRRGINDVSRAGAQMAREEHPWDNETGQTEASVFVRDADVELVGTTPAATPHVWGEWGVEDRPRYKHAQDASGAWNLIRNQHGDRIPEDVSTKDVAMFLEFGTVRMFPRPWLYPAWDATKVQLPARIALRYREIAASGAPFAVRSALGRFISLRR